MPKPKFDPNQAFTPAGDEAQAKPKFNPNLPAQPVDDQASPSLASQAVGLAQKGVQGLQDYGNYMKGVLKAGGNAATMGFLPKISGAAHDTLGTPTKEEMQADLAKVAQEQPVANVMGTIGGSLMPGAAGAKAVKMLAPAGSALGTYAANVGVSGAMGGLQEPAPGSDDTQRIKNAEGSAGIAALLGLAPTALRAAAPAVKWAGGKLAAFTPDQTRAYAASRPEIKEMAGLLGSDQTKNIVQDKASGVISRARDNLEAAGKVDAAKLANVFQGKTVEITPRSLLGVSPEIDEIINSKVQQHVGLPSTMNLDASEANRIKQILQKNAKYPAGTVLDPNQQARVADIGSKASALRSQIEDVGGPEVSSLNQAMQQRALLNKELRSQGRKNPLAYLSSESNDKTANLARAESQGAGPELLDFGTKYGAAKKIHAGTIDDSLKNKVLQGLGRATITGGQGMQSVGTGYTPTLQEIMALVRTQQQQSGQ